MMKRGLTHSACLKGASFRHCFVSFPHQWRAFVASASIPTFKLESANHSLIVSWTGHTHDYKEEEEKDTIYISLKLLKINKFSEGEIIIVRQVTCPSPCTSASMLAVSSTDWEELLLNVEVAQEAFLSQFRVVKKDQVVPLWLEGGASIYLKIDELSSSSSFGLLQLNTEVEILPPSRHSFGYPPLAITPSKQNEIEKQSKVKSKKNFWNILYTIFILLDYGNKKVGVSPKQELFLGLKVIPYSPPDHYQQNLFLKILTSHPSVIFVSEVHLKTTKYGASRYFVSKVSKVNNGKTSNDNLSLASSETSSDTIMVIVMVWEKVKEIMGDDIAAIWEIDLILRRKACILSNSLRRKLSLEKNSIIVLETLNCPVRSRNFQIDVNIINSCAKDERYVSSNLVSLLTDLTNTCPVILNDSSVMNMNIDSKGADFLIMIRDGNPVFLEKASVPLLSINIELNSSKRPTVNYKSVEEINSRSKQSSSKILVNEKTLDDLVNTIKRDLNFELKYPALCPQFIMLEGSKGSGKTVLTESLVEKLSETPYFVHCEIIRLKLLKGKRVDSVQKVLKTAIKEALDYQPSLIVLDDLDFLAPAHSVVEEKGMFFDYITYMAFMIKSLLTQLLESMKRNAKASLSERDCVSVVATCCSRNGVLSFLSTPKGNNVFPKSIRISPLNGENKLKILQSSLKDMHKNFLNENIISRSNDETDKSIFQYSENEVIAKLDGLTLPDINTLARRISLEAKARWKLCYHVERENHFSETDERSKDLLSYLSEDVANALNGFVSLSSKAVNLSTTPKKKRKIGGLRKAQETLEEMILWPSKYPHLFSQTKLRLRSGILLYGPPGCGKTLLANSFQSITHLNFITVKGPELLSKYIGQSEKSVRDAFERAESAKPCVLFFDEFESIAPRRGHDNTGVTDRVVNQLLTQMDGVEGLSGVYVVAATSRPDLIDPALLRPGRLDKGIYCPIPNENEREEILSVLSEEITFEGVVDFKEIARKTDGFTGADLQSLLSTAQVKAAQEAIGRSLYEAVLDEEANDDAKVEIDSMSDEFVEVAMDSNNRIRTSVFEREIDDRKGDRTARWSDPLTERTDDEKDLSISVTEKHFLKSLVEIQPSINDKERLKHEALHNMFSIHNEKVFAVVKPGKRETLA